jgi:hypothetical protein
VVLVGIAMWIAQHRASAAAIVAPLTALSLPLAGTLIYLPWSIVAPYYAGAFLPGDALLLALALTALERSRPRAVWWAGVGAVAIIYVLDAAAAARAASRFNAQRQLDASVTALVDHLGGATAAVQQPIGIYSGRMEAYGRAVVDTAFPPIEEEPCNRAHDTVRRQAAIVFTYIGECPTSWADLPAPDRTVRDRFRYLSLSHLRLESDSVRADFWVPRQRPASSS